MSNGPHSIDLRSRHEQLGACLQHWLNKLVVCRETMQVHFLVQSVLTSSVERQDCCCTRSEVSSMGKLTVVVLASVTSSERVMITLGAQCYTLGGNGC